MRYWKSLWHQTNEQSSEHRKLATRKSRILYGITVGTGAFSYHRGQLSWFRRQGWQVILSTIDDEPARMAAQREGVKLLPIEMVRDISPKDDIPTFISWFKAIRRLKPDVTNLSTPKASLLGGVAAWILRVPRRIYIVRGLRIEGSQGLMSKLLWLVEWTTQRLATDVVFVSRSLAEEAYRRNLLPTANSWLIGEGSSNGVDARAIQERINDLDSREIKSRLDIPDGCTVIGFVGRLTKDKGVDALLEVIESKDLGDSCMFLIIGPVEDEGLTERLAMYGERVRTTGWTDDVWGFLPAIDVLLLPTHREGFPNVVLEAASAAIPTITTTATGAIDSVIDGKTGFIVDIDDSEAMIRRIRQLSQCPALVRELGQNAQSRAEVLFKPERIWKGLLSITEGDPDPLLVTNIRRECREGKAQ